MAKSFTFSELNNLIKEVRNVLYLLKTADQHINHYKQEIIRKCNILIKRNFFINRFSYDITTLRANDINTDDIMDLLKSIYCYKQSIQYAKKCKDLYNAHSNEIENKLATVSAGKNPIKWIFINKDKKAKVEEGYEVLKNELVSEFYRDSTKTINELTQLQMVDSNIVLENYKQNVEKYNDSLYSVYNNIFYFGNRVPEINELFIKYNAITKKFNSINEKIDPSKKLIKNTVDKLLAFESLNAGKKIPIEELNREKNGIRIKALAEAGYKNLADINAVSIVELASIPGISYNSANTIRRIASEYTKEAQKGLKISLSVDDKNSKSDAVVSAIFSYKKLLEIIDERNDLVKQYSKEIVEKLETLKQLINGVKYYFSDKQTKEYYLNTYKSIKIALDDEYGKKAERIMFHLNELKTIDTRRAWEDFESNSIIYFNILEDVYPGVLGNSDAFYGLPEKLLREVQEQAYFPDGLLCTLRKYQELGVKYILHQEKVLLGDEMGLGKTIQAIATMVSLKNTGATHFMVICPASVISNWCREISKHSKLKPTMIHGRMRKKAIESWIENGGVAVTTYETTQHIDINNLSKISLIVVDEAHYIKNPEAKRTRNTIALCNKAERLLFMTGTALENRVEEMINLIRILNRPVAEEAERIAFMSAAAQFREKIAGVYYRRKRDDVLTELPELIESEEWCTMTKQEEVTYEESVLCGSYNEARRVSWNVDNLDQSSKAIRLKEIVEEAHSEGRKVLVFSFFLKTIERIQELLGEKCSGVIKGDVNPNKRQEIIDDFDKDTEGSVLVAQIMAGGTGLNIQSASVVIICEPQFKPSIENQAISRAYRMGQARNVLVYRLLCENTIDERITDLLKQKQKEFDAFADKSVAAEKSENNGVDDKEFGNIIKEEIDRINKKRGIIKDNIKTE